MMDGPCCCSRSCAWCDRRSPQIRKILRVGRRHRDPRPQQFTTTLSSGHHPIFEPRTKGYSARRPSSSRDRAGRRGDRRGPTWTMRVKPASSSPTIGGPSPAPRGRPADYVYRTRWLDPICARRASDNHRPDVGARRSSYAASGLKFRLDRPSRGCARADRYTCASPTEPNFPKNGTERFMSARAQRGRRRSRRRRHSHPGGRYGSVSLARMETRLTHHAGRKPGLPRASLSGERPACACGADAQHAGQAVPAGRRGRSQHHRRGHHAAAAIRAGRARLHRAPRRGRQPLACRRQAQAGIRGARRDATRLSGAVSVHVLLQYGRSHPWPHEQRAHRVAPRHRWRWTSKPWQGGDAGQALPANQLVPPAWGATIPTTVQAAVRPGAARRCSTAFPQEFRRRSYRRGRRKP